MVLTDRQRNDLHAGIYEYLRSRGGEAFQRAADAIAEADPEACQSKTKNGTNGTDAAPPEKISTVTPLLEKKWTAIPRLQKKVMELERVAAQSTKIHAHRVGTTGDASTTGQRRMLPRIPCQHAMSGHSAVVTTVALHPVFTVVASGSEDGTIKVCFVVASIVCANDRHEQVNVRASCVSYASFLSRIHTHTHRFGITRVENTCVH
jgi:platelet-activating factor acetylhydrolase IB subunit alpha